MRGEFYIYFDGQFWLGLFSLEKEGVVVRVGRYLFGVEPTAAEVDAWVTAGLPGLRMIEVQDKGIEIPSVREKVQNPKRSIRALLKSKRNTRTTESAAQRSMRELIEQSKKEAKSAGRKKRREKEVQNFVLRKEKRKKKHRGQ